MTNNPANILWYQVIQDLTRQKPSHIAAPEDGRTPVLAERGGSGKMLRDTTDFSHFELDPVSELI